MYLTRLPDRSPTNGPALTITSLIPDLHHYNGRGGRVSRSGATPPRPPPNVRPALLDFLTDTLGIAVTAEDMMAYIAELLAHPAFTARFKADLVQPGLRVPLTADAALFGEAVALSREVVWLHTYGERFADAGADRPSGPPRLIQVRRAAHPGRGGRSRHARALAGDDGIRPATRRLHRARGSWRT